MVETTINIEINIEYITISTKLVHNVFTFIIFKGGGGLYKMHNINNHQSVN